VRVSQFFTSASAYDRFMGRFSAQLGPPFADFAGVEAVGRALDVGCGPGGLTAELAVRLGAENVSAIDPSEAFVEAARARNPEVDVRQAPAEEIPFADDTFDFALAQLVVHFMTDAVAGLREMARVTRQSGSVAACVWDYYGGMSPLSPFWSALEEFDPAAENESQLAGAREGQLGNLFREAGLEDGRSRRSPSASSSRASRSGGRRTSSASAPLERTSRSSPRRGAKSSASSAARACLRRRSRSQAKPGRRAASPRDAVIALGRSDAR
jgi:SAM-dependent methyltransferase